MIGIKGYLNQLLTVCRGASNHYIGNSFFSIKFNHIVEDYAYAAHVRAMMLPGGGLFSIGLHHYNILDGQPSKANKTGQFLPAHQAAKPSN